MGQTTPVALLCFSERETQKGESRSIWPAVRYITDRTTRLVRRSCEERKSPPWTRSRLEEDGLVHSTCTRGAAPLELEADLHAPQTELTQSTATHCGSAGLLALPGLFLLNPANRAFIAGDTRRIERPGAAKTSGVRRWIDGVWILCQIALAIGLFVGTAPIVLRAFLLHAAGETTEGVVTGAWTEFAGKSTAYHIEYRFAVGRQDEHTYSAEVKVDGSAYTRLAKGSRVEVVYLPLDPDISDVASGSLSENDPSVVGLFAVVSGGAVVWMVRFRYRRYRLSKHGKLLHGVIASWKEQRRAGKGGTGVHYWTVEVK